MYLRSVSTECQVELLWLSIIILVLTKYPGGHTQDPVTASQYAPLAQAHGSQQPLP